MRGLKILVGIMSTLIVAGLALFAYGITTLKSPTGTADVTLALPSGSQIRSMSGIGNQLAIHIGSRDGEFIYMYDPGTNRITKRIHIEKK